MRRGPVRGLPPSFFSCPPQSSDRTREGRTAGEQTSGLQQSLLVDGEGGGRILLELSEELGFMDGEEATVTTG